MSVAGTYDIAIQSPMGEQKGQLTVTPEGDGFSGTVSNAMMGTMDVLDGRIDGNKLTWKMDMKVPMPMTLECDATVDGVLAAAHNDGLLPHEPRDVVAPLRDF